MYTSTDLYEDLSNSIMVIKVSTPVNVLMKIFQYSLAMVKFAVHIFSTIYILPK